MANRFLKKLGRLIETSHIQQGLTRAQALQCLEEALKSDHVKSHQTTMSEASFVKLLNGLLPSISQHKMEAIAKVFDLDLKEIQLLYRSSKDPSYEELYAYVGDYLEIRNSYYKPGFLSVSILTVYEEKSGSIKVKMANDEQDKYYYDGYVIKFGRNIHMSMEERGKKELIHMSFIQAVGEGETPLYGLHSASTIDDEPYATKSVLLRDVKGLSKEDKKYIRLNKYFKKNDLVSFINKYANFDGVDEMRIFKFLESNSGPHPSIIIATKSVFNNLS